jgi:hypothetical protein
LASVSSAASMGLAPSISTTGSRAPLRAKSNALVRPWPDAEPEMRTTRASKSPFVCMVMMCPTDENESAPGAALPSYLPLRSKIRRADTGVGPDLFGAPVHQDGPQIENDHPVTIVHDEIHVVLDQ